MRDAEHRQPFFMKGNHRIEPARGLRVDHRHRDDRQGHQQSQQGYAHHASWDSAVAMVTASGCGDATLAIWPFGQLTFQFFDFLFGQLAIRSAQEVRANWKLEKWEMANDADAPL